jgi:hypothetical protein
MMETAWNWNGQAAEVVRTSYETILQDAETFLHENLLSERDLSDLLEGIKAIKPLSNEAKTAAMKAMHFAAKGVWLGVQSRVTQLENDIDGLAKMPLNPCES